MFTPKTTVVALSCPDFGGTWNRICRCQEKNIIVVNTNQGGGSIIVSYFDKAAPLVSWRRASMNKVLALLLDVYKVLLNQ